MPRRINAAPFFRGTPTGPDIDRLIARFGVPEEDTEIALETIAGVIGSSANSCRFKTVVNSWRRRLFRENNVFLKGTGTKSLVVANPSLRIESAHGFIAKSKNAAVKGVVLAYGTDASRLTDAENKSRDRILQMQTQKKLKMADKVMAALPMDTSCLFERCTTRNNKQQGEHNGI